MAVACYRLRLLMFAACRCVVFVCCCSRCCCVSVLIVGDVLLSAWLAAVGCCLFFVGFRRYPLSLCGLRRSSLLLAGCCCALVCH